MREISAITKQIIQSRIDHPEYTLGTIGLLYGITRERVRQILKRANVCTQSSRYRTLRICKRCNKSYVFTKQSGVATRIFCSSICRSSMVTLECTFCHKNFMRSRSLYQAHNTLQAKYPKYTTLNVFCSRSCFHSFRIGVPKITKIKPCCI